MNPNAERIRLYAKQLKIPTFADYAEVLRRADPSADFAQLLLELMKAETESRQENQNRRRLKAAGFPYLKTMEEFDRSQLNDAVSPVFLNELASYNGPLVQTKFQKIIMNQIMPYRSILFPEPAIHAFPAVAALRSRVALTG